MGGVASSLHRVRNKFLLSLHQKGLDNKYATIGSIFNNVETDEVDGIQIISKANLIELIGIESSDAIEVLFEKCRFQNDHMPLHFVIDFMEKGCLQQSTMETVKKQMVSESMYSEVRKSLGLNQTKNATTAIIKYKSAESQSNENNNHIIELEKEAHPMWKKHEIVIQEKIVKQVSIDKEGTITELITTDKSQNDIIHVESKADSELFAHREFTQQEQTEELNQEMVTFIRATEEYIHLKSKEDEYEYVHSEIPSQGEQEMVSEKDDDSIQKSFSDYDKDRAFDDNDLDFNF